MKTLLMTSMILLIAGTLFGQQVETSTTRGLAFVQAGSPITLINDEPNVQSFKVSFGHSYVNITLQPVTSTQFPSPETGYAIIDSDKTDFMVSSSVGGVEFLGQKLITNERGFAATSSTGIVLANPWSQSNRIAFLVYAESGKQIANIPQTLRSGESKIGFFKDLVMAPGQAHVFVQILSAMPILLGTAECVSGKCENTPIRSYGVFENGPFLGPQGIQQSNTPLSPPGGDR